MSELQVGGDGGGFEQCVRCGALAAGPCARCGRPVCGDCCVLTEGGAGTWAVCVSCDRRGGRSLGPGWVMVIGWIAVPIVALGVALIVLEWLFGRSCV
jgi:hypothetical protein